MDNITLCSQEKAKPPIVIATLNVRMSLNAKLQNEVVMVVVLIHHKYNVDKEPPKPPYERQFCCKFILLLTINFASYHSLIIFSFIVFNNYIDILER